MPIWLIKVLEYLGPKLITWLTDIYTQYQKVKKLERKVDDKLKKAEEYEKNPTSTNADNLP